MIINYLEKKLGMKNNLDQYEISDKIIHADILNEWWFINL